MKKQIVLLTAVLSSGLVTAATTTETKLNQKTLTLKDRIEVSYYGEANAGQVVANEEPNTSLYNAVKVNYKLDNGATLYIQPRFSLVDSAKDRLDEADLRMGINKFIPIRGDKLGYFAQLRVGLPTSRSSEKDSDRIININTFHAADIKIDDVNSLFAGAALSKTLRSKANAAVNEYSRFALQPYISYKNKYLSEKYPIRIDFEGSLSQNAGRSDTNLKADAGSERIIIGSEFDISKTNLYPYIQHDPSKVKALDILGAGIQLSRTF